jgi:hypothetical protein
MLTVGAGKDDAVEDCSHYGFEKDIEHEEGSHSGDSHDSIHRDHGSVLGGGPVKPEAGKRLMGWKGSFG